MLRFKTHRQKKRMNQFYVGKNALFTKNRIKSVHTLSAPSSSSMIRNSNSSFCSRNSCDSFKMMASLHSSWCILSSNASCLLLSRVYPFGSLDCLFVYVCVCNSALADIQYCVIDKNGRFNDGKNIESNKKRKEKKRKKNK